MLRDEMWIQRVAAGTARAVVMPLERTGGQAQFIVHTPPGEQTSLSPLLMWIEAHLDREAKKIRARKMIRELRSLGYRVELVTSQSGQSSLIGEIFDPFDPG
jgi:hypothetical protein